MRISGFMDVQQELVEMVSSSGYAPTVIRAALPPGVDQDKLSWVDTYRLNHNAALRLGELLEAFKIPYVPISFTRSVKNAVLTWNQLEALRARPEIVSMMALDYVALGCQVKN